MGRNGRDKAFVYYIERCNIEQEWNERRHQQTPTTPTEPAISASACTPNEEGSSTPPVLLRRDGRHRRVPEAARIWRPCSAWTPEAGAHGAHSLIERDRVVISGHDLDAQGLRGADDRVRYRLEPEMLEMLIRCLDLRNLVHVRKYETGGVLVTNVNVRSG
jgi:hypothetical protein